MDLVEATFRYQFSHNESGEQSNVSAYCVGFQTKPDDPSQGGDPPSELISRLRDVVPAVRPISECRITPNGRDGVKDPSGKSALIFVLGAAKCASESRCEVEGGYYEASESSSSNTYVLEKQDGKWVVVKDVMHWIS
jgi:hypothetical protein